MNRHQVPPTLGLVAAAIATLLCYHLLAVHMDASPRPAWFAIGCGEDSATGSDCEAVLASPYSYWPAKVEGEPAGRRHVPVALVGLLYYAALTVWLLGIGRVSRKRRFWHLPPVLFVGLGLIVSIRYIAIMAAETGAWCLWCGVTHALNAIIAVCLILMWPRRVRAAADSDAPAIHSEAPPHPSGRALVTTCLAVWLAWFGLAQFYGHSARAKQAMALNMAFDQCRDTIDRYTGNGAPVMALWLETKAAGVSIDADDPVRMPADSSLRPLDLVVFSDMECPNCKRLAEFLDRDVAPLFDGRIRLAFRHYPLHHDCNPATTTDIHRHACDGARLLEAAREVGGDTAFWKAHDLVFERQDRLKLGRLTPGEVAEALGLDAERFVQAFESRRVLDRIEIDSVAAKPLGVRNTPTLFAAGREVPTPERDDIRFWDKLADHYWQGLGIPRPASTMRATDRPD